LRNEISFFFFFFFNIPHLLGQLCLSCLLAAMEELPNGPAAFGALNVCGAQQGKKYFNGGQNGQLILSKVA
jgi:hypothetical protein